MASPKPAAPLSKIKIVIFDLDGTLVNAYKAVAESINYALRALDIPAIDDYTIQRNVGWGEKVLVSRFVPASQMKRALVIYRRHHKTALKTGVKFLPGALRTLRVLSKEGIHLAIASNRPSYFTNIILKTLKVRPLFCRVVCADKVARPKPYADMLQEILRRQKLKPAQALYVGDMTIDVITGRRAKVKTVAVTTGSSTRGELGKEKPFRIISNVSQSLAVLGLK